MFVLYILNKKHHLRHTITEFKAQDIFVFWYIFPDFLDNQLITESFNKIINLM